MTKVNGKPVPLQGVVTVQPQLIHLDLQKQVARVLEGVEEGRTMAVLNIHTAKGINIAVSHKLNEEWRTILYVGKSGWDTPLNKGWEGAVGLAFSR